MSKISISIWLIVAANLVFVSDSAMSKLLTGGSFTTEMRSDRSPHHHVLAKSSTQPDRVTEDEVFDDVVLNRVAKLKQFLSKGGNPDRYFHAAVNAGAIDCVKLMIARGANVNLPDNDGLTPVMTSARVTYRGGIEMTELLIKKGANVNARASKGSTALMYAASGVAAHYEDEYVRVVRILIKHGAKVNVKNQMGATPLSIAKEGKYLKIVAVLKQAGAKS